MKIKKAKWKKIISIILIIFFVFSCILLLFATFALKNHSSLFGYRFYYVLTKSMEPDIKQGTLIIVEEISVDELKVGDVISFVSRDPDISGQINTHAIDSISYDVQGDPVFTTKGTNNPAVDEYPVYPGDIRGRLVYQSAFLGEVFNVLSNRWVSFCITILPLSIIVLIYFVDLVKVINFFPDDDKIKREEQNGLDAEKSDTEKEVNNDSQK